MRQRARDAVLTTLLATGVLAAPVKTAGAAGETWTPEASDLAVVSSRDGNSEIYLKRAGEEARVTQILFTSRRLEAGEEEPLPHTSVMNADGPGQRRLLSESPQSSAGARWSPDGSDLVVVNRDGTDRQVVLTGGRHWYPSWSSDGRWLVYTVAVSEDSDEDPDLFAVRLSGGAPIPLVTGPGREAEGVWSPDPTRSPAPAEIEAKPAQRVFFQSFEWSPDGRRAVFSSIEVARDWSDYAAENWRSYLIDIATGRVEPLAPGVLYPSFDPAGERVVASQQVGKQRDVVSIDLATSVITNLTQSDSKDSGPSFSPNGDRIVFHSNRDGVNSIYVMAHDGSDVRRITDQGELAAYNPVWAPQGERIVYYVSDGEPRDQVYVTDSSGTRPRNVTDDDHHNVYPSWARDGQIVYTRDDGTAVCFVGADGTGRRVIEGPSGFFARESPDGSQLAVLDDQGRIVLHDMSDGTERVLLDQAAAPRRSAISQ